jgi:hypothetical protein
VDLRQPVDASPREEASPATGAMFGRLQALSLSPKDARAHISDIDLDDSGAGAVHVVRAGGAPPVIVTPTGEAIDEPTDIVALPDGRVALVDPAADPSGLGNDRYDNAVGGHGAVFWLDVATGIATVLADGTVHGSMPGIPSGESAFDEPTALAYDASRRVLYVVDRFADPLNLDATNDLGAGTLYAVDLGTGSLRVVSSSAVEFVNLVAATVRPGGDVLIVDSLVIPPPPELAVSSAIWTVDVDDPDPRFNFDLLTLGDDSAPPNQYGELKDVVVDAAERVFVLDFGLYDDDLGEFVVVPRILRVDEMSADIAHNGVIVSEPFEFISPISLDVVPAFRVDRVTPSLVPARPLECATVPVELVIAGSGLVPGMTYDLGPSAQVVAAEYLASGSGAAIVLEVLPVPPTFGGTLDLTVTHSFGETTTYPGVVSFAGGNSGESPAPPFSTRGDASRDGQVDGIDLAMLGMHFGTEYCDGDLFLNDVDFNDDDVIDGRDLAVLAVYFGARL